MWSRRHTTVSVFLLLLAASLLFGCRAFQPEVVIVNKPPETYIVGCPAETSGAYFHFHIYWYGSDKDGDVERFVWALTDTSIQDIETADDEEDDRFNPAVNINTLNIGNYTTRTDTVFNFELNQGSAANHHMTLHMVAVDDRGDFDRTPARLHFYSNALGQPVVRFSQVLPDGSKTSFASEDTIPFGSPLELVWDGSTPNIRSFTPAMLETLERAQPIPIEPFDDGILGFKWQLLGEDCDGGMDCWKPKQFDPATGDSFSFFGPDIGLSFLNDGPPGAGIRTRTLPSGVVRLMVNAIDVAGVEVPTRLQVLNINVNYAPSTRLLFGDDPDSNSWNPSTVNPAHYDDESYPYYYVHHGEFKDIHYRFSQGDTVPNYATVVFKAVGRDNILDKQKYEDVNGVQFQGKFDAYGLWEGNLDYNFSSAASDPHSEPEWAATNWGDLSADTLSFMVGPVDYTFSMRSIDEHGRRDHNPPEFKFSGNFPPSVQCVEFLDDDAEPSSYIPPDDEPDMYDLDCLNSVSEMYAEWNGFDDQDQCHYMSRQANDAMIWISPVSGDVSIEEPLDIDGYFQIPAYVWSYRIALHGRDHPLEDTGNNYNRVLAWRYELQSDLDVENAIKDGGGIDNIEATTEQRGGSPTAGVFVDDHGIWYVKVHIWAPRTLVDTGSEAYWDWLQQIFGNPETPDLPETIYRLSTMQWGSGSIRVQASDAVSCLGYAAAERGKYYLYRGLRTPAEGHGCGCDESLVSDVFTAIGFSRFAKYSELVEKRFNFQLETTVAGVREMFDPEQLPTK